ncbi:MAG: helix-turn-helix domain-containing protein [Ignavibacteriae bacterium]|nr:helix-turn-helix domain-containing protein [Ignavibacteriota bacterium]MCB9216625.1 helix-turn-helix domain-containing protein [Ignavibacteria bacterium]
MKTTHTQSTGTIILQLSPDELASVIRSNVGAVIDERFPDKGKTSLQPPQPIDPLYTASECSELLDVTRKTLREWEKQGRLCPVRIGRRTYYRRSDIDTALKGEI